MGGTESATLRLLLELSRYVRIVFMQFRRDKVYISSDSLIFVPPVNNIGQYLPRDARLTPDYIIAIRHDQALSSFRTAFPQVPIYIWVHDYDIWGTAPSMPFHDIAGLVFVSEWFMQATVTGWKKQGVVNYERLHLVVIYNSISEEFHRVSKIGPALDIDFNRMLSLSAPVKGLMAAFPLLFPIFQEIPELRLTILSPW